MNMPLHMNAAAWRKGEFMKLHKAKRWLGGWLALSLAMHPAMSVIGPSLAYAEEAVWEEASTEEEELLEESLDEIPLGETGALDASLIMEESDPGEESPEGSKEQTDLTDALDLEEGLIVEEAEEAILPETELWEEDDEEVNRGIPVFYRGYDDAADDERARLVAADIASIYLQNYGDDYSDDGETDEDNKVFVPYSFVDPDSGVTYNFCEGSKSTGNYKKSNEKKDGWYHKWAFTRERSVQYFLKDGSSTGQFRAYCVEPAKASPKNGSYTYGGVLDGNLSFSADTLGENRFYVLNSNGTDKAARLVRAMYYLYGGPAWGETVNGINMKAEIERYLDPSDYKGGKYWAMSHYIISYIFDPSEEVFNRWASQDKVADERTEKKAEVGSTGSRNWNWLKKERQFTPQGHAVFEKLAGILEQLPIPETLLRRSDASVESYQYASSYQAEEKRLLSESITYSALRENTAVIDLPAGDVLIFEDGTEMRGQVTIAGGTTFRIATSDLSKGGQTEKIRVKCRYDTDMVPVLITSEERRQDIVGAYHKSKQLGFGVSWQAVGFGQVIKSSSVDAISAANRLYSLSGAKYGLYEDARCTDLLDTLTTGGAYDTGKVTSEGEKILESRTNVSIPLTPGTTYYIKEIEAPAGYKMDEQVYSFAVSTSHTENAPYVLHLTDEPLYDPMMLMLEKTGETKSAEKGSIEPEGAEFELCFYDAYFEKADLKEHTPLRTWTIAVKKDQETGRFLAVLNEEAKGDPLYRDAGGRIALPLGTLVIRESRPASGYTLEGAGVVTGNGEKIDDLPYLLPILPSEDKTSASVQRVNKEDGAALMVHNDRIGIQTVALDDESQSHVSNPKAEGSITDTVTLRNLTPGEEYILAAELIDEKDGTRAAASQSENFIADAAYGEWQTEKVVFDKTQLSSCEGRTLLVNEYLFKKADAEKIWVNAEEHLQGVNTEAAIAMHTADLMTESEKEAQRIYVPWIRTKAQAKDGALQVMMAAESAEVIDTVLYEGLDPAEKYLLKGTIYELVGDRPVEVRDSSGKAIRAEKTLEVHESGSGESTITFSFDASAMAGKRLVIFEEVYLQREGESASVKVAGHEEPLDMAQRIYIPGIATKAMDQATQHHLAMAAESTILTDTVQYTGLKEGETYRLRAAVMKRTSSDGDRVSVEALDTLLLGEDGQEIAYYEFTPTEPDGTVTISVKVDTTALAGEAMVVYERLSLVTQSMEEGAEGERVEWLAAKHEDPEDEDQTVYVPAIRTSAAAKDNGLHETQAAEKSEILDEVRYTNLVPGLSYRMSGTLYDKETGKALQDADGKAYTQSQTFTAQKANGSLTMHFTVNTKDLAGKCIVVFETCSVESKEGDIAIARHQDLTDEEQSVKIVAIGTHLMDKDTGRQTLSAGTDVTLRDSVTYTGLTPGKTYTVSGVLMEKESGQSTKITGRTTFKPATANGTVYVDFKLNASKYGGKHLVAFEQLLDEKSNTIAVHEDLTDSDQTVTLTKVKKTGKETEGSKKKADKPSVSGSRSTSASPVKTGDTTPLGLYGILCIAALGMMAVGLKLRRRRS